MTNTELFIQKAVEGRWGGFEWRENIRVEERSDHELYAWVWGEAKSGESHAIPLSTILLDPLAWQAVGKVEWGSKDEPLLKRAESMKKQAGEIDRADLSQALSEGAGKVLEDYLCGDWKGNMHGMIDALCNGTSIEDYLGSILTK